MNTCMQLASYIATLIHQLHDQLAILYFSTFHAFLMNHIHTAITGSYIIPNSSLDGNVVASQLATCEYPTTVLQCILPCDYKNTFTCNCCSYVYVYNYSVVGYLAIQLSIDIAIICSRDMQLWLIASQLTNQMNAWHCGASLMSLQYTASCFVICRQLAS